MILFFSRLYFILLTLPNLIQYWGENGVTVLHIVLLSRPKIKLREGMHENKISLSMREAKQITEHHKIRIYSWHTT